MGGLTTLLTTLLANGPSVTIVARCDLEADVVRWIAAGLGYYEQGTWRVARWPKGRAAWLGLFRRRVRHPERVLKWEQALVMRLRPGRAGGITVVVSQGSFR
jgi:hypothetical protein